MQCDKCGYDTRLVEGRCIHCYRRLGSGIATFPNVDDAEAERDELEMRYNREKTTSGHPEEVVSSFVDHLLSSRAVMRVDLKKAYRIALSDRLPTLTSYARYQTAKIRLGRRDDPWFPLRLKAEIDLFRGYGDDIEYAALTIDDHPLVRYGECVIEFDEHLIGHRATVFEWNTAAWYRDTPDAHDDATRSRGHRATWRDRFKLAYAKLARYLPLPLETAILARLLLAEGPTEADTLIEVNILGSITARTAKYFRIPKAYEGNHLYETIREHLTSIGVELRGD